MFRCGVCEIKSLSSEKPNRVITNVRKVEYLNVSNKERISEGWEISKEKDMCSPCSELMTLDLPKAIANAPITQRYVEVIRYTNNYTDKRGASGEGYSDTIDKNESRRRSSR